MFIINLTYRVSLDKVDEYLVAHVRFLEEQYALGNFLASGPKVPREGGVILANVKDQATVLEIIEKDPFKINGIADYQLIEFVPRKTSKELEFLQPS